MSGIIGQLRQFYTLLKNERFFKIFAVTCFIIRFGALALFFVDRHYHTKGAGGLFDATYCAVVAIGTVGYGDIVPSTNKGRIFAPVVF